jgi:type IV secretory pathway VirB2 component (pilin)
VSKKFLICLGVAVGLAALFAFAPEALADNAATVFTKTASKLSNLFGNLRKILYIAGAFALIGVAVAGILGKVKWATVAHLAAGLFILVIATEIINYVAKDTQTDISQIVPGGVTGDVVSE